MTGESALSARSGDAVFMARALELAEHGRYSTRPNPCVGCVLTRDGQIVAEGWHKHTGGPHAEVRALQMADTDTDGCCCYVTLEPCCHQGETPPCTDALIQAGITRVVVAMEDPDPRVRGNGVAALRVAGLTVDTGLMAEQAAHLNRGFIQRMQQSRPFVRLKLAASLDGRTAARHGESKWITSAPARQDVQQWRAMSGAILTGIGTVLADDPRLTVREESLLGPAGQPLRVVVDSSLRIAAGARMFTQDGQTLVATTIASDPHLQAIEDVEVLVFAASVRRVPLAALLQTLAARKINDVLVESGSTLAGALLEQRLVDELVLYLAPSLLGDEAPGLAGIAGLERLGDSVALEYRDVRRVGPDLRVIATVVQNKM